MIKGSMVAAWLLGEGIVAWRVHHATGRPPSPGLLLGITGLFAGLGALAGYQPAAGFAVAVAWGLDLAGLMDVLPAGLGGQVTKAAAAEQQAQHPAAGAPAPQGQAV